MLLYAVFLAGFLMAFFVTFRNTVSGLFSDAESREISVRSASSLQDAFGRMASDPASLAAHNPYYYFEYVDNDGRTRSDSVYAGIPQTYRILYSGAESSFKIASVSGDPVGVDVFDSAGIPYSHAALFPGNSGNVAIPKYSSGTVRITSLGSVSGFVIDRRSVKFLYPGEGVRAYRIAGRLKEFLGIYRVTDQ